MFENQFTLSLQIFMYLLFLVWGLYNVELYSENHSHILMILIKVWFFDSLPTWCSKSCSGEMMRTQHLCFKRDTTIKNVGIRRDWRGDAIYRFSLNRWVCFITFLEITYFVNSVQNDWCNYLGDDYSLYCCSWSWLMGCCQTGFYHC